MPASSAGVSSSDLDLPALALAVADQHAHRASAPSRCASTPPAPDVIWTIAPPPIELARQHALELDLVERALRSTRPAPSASFARRLVARFFGELEQHLGIGERAHLRVPAADDLLELLLVAQQRLRLLLVVPEVRPRGDRVELLDLQALVVDVKATSGARPPCRRAPSAARAPRAHRYLRSPWRTVYRPWRVRRADKVGACPSATGYLPVKHARQ